MIRPKIPLVQNGQRLTSDLVNSMIHRTEYAADLLRQYRLTAGTEMYVEPHYDGTRVSYFYPVAGGATPRTPPPSPEPYIPFTITWTTVGNVCNPNPWTITNSGTTIKVVLADSLNCGGTCDQRQTASASSVIKTGSSSVDMNIAFSGVVELQSENYDRIRFALSGPGINKFIAEAKSPGGGLQCIVGNATTTYLEPPPYRLNKNSTYNFTILMDTIDELYHFGCFYIAQLTFTEIFE